MPVTLSKLKKAVQKAGGAVTSASLAEIGFVRFPVEPSGELDAERLERWVDAGMPEDAYFEDRMVMSGPAWDSYRRDKPRAFDPISRQLLDTDTAAAWDSLAPVQLVDRIVSQADLAAFGADQRVLHREVTSYLYLRHGARGTTPIPMSSCPELLPAARLWPYIRRAADIARERRSSPGPEQEGTVGDYRRTSEAAYHAPSAPSEQMMKRRPMAPGAPREEQLEAAITRAFTRSEFGALLRAVAGYHFDQDLPPEIASFTTYVHEAVRKLARTGALDTRFFDALVAQRPKTPEFQALRQLWSC